MTSDEQQSRCRCWYDLRGPYRQPERVAFNVDVERHAFTVFTRELRLRQHTVVGDDKHHRFVYG